MSIVLLWGLGWFLVGAVVTAFILYRKGHDPIFGAVLVGIVGAFGNIVALAFIWLWLWYFLPNGTFRRYGSVDDLFRRR